MKQTNQQYGLLPEWRGELVGFARTLRGMSQTDLAQAVGIKQSRLSKTEAGMTPITPELAQSLSHILEVPVSFFASRCRVSGLAVFHRKLASASRASQKALEASISFATHRVSQLLDMVDVTFPLSVPVIPSDDRGPEEIAAEVRRVWKMPSGPVSNLIETLEDAGVFVFRADLGAKRLVAASQWLPGEPPVMFVNEKMPTDRVRFSLAHELGHLVMHQDCDLERDMEREADRFSAAFLMPGEVIKPYLSPLRIDRYAALKRDWKVSMQSLALRARDLAVVTESQYRRFMQSMGAEGYRTNEPSELKREEPTLAYRLVESLLRVHSREELCELIWATEADFSLWFQRGLRKI